MKRLAQTTPERELEQRVHSTIPEFFGDKAHADEFLMDLFGMMDEYTLQLVDSDLSQGVNGVVLFIDGWPPENGLDRMVANTKLALLHVAGKYGAVADVMLPDVETLEYNDLLSRAGQAAVLFEWPELVRKSTLKLHGTLKEFIGQEVAFAPQQSDDPDEQVGIDLLLSVLDVGTEGVVTKLEQDNETFAESIWSVSFGADHREYYVRGMHLAPLGEEKYVGPASFRQSKVAMSPSDLIESGQGRPFVWASGFLRVGTENDDHPSLAEEFPKGTKFQYWGRIAVNGSSVGFWSPESPAEAKQEGDTFANCLWELTKHGLKRDAEVQFAYGESTTYPELMELTTASKTPEELGVTYQGEQKFRNRPTMEMYKDNATGTTFVVEPGETLEQAIVRVKKRYNTEQTSSLRFGQAKSYVYFQDIETQSIAEASLEDSPIPELQGQIYFFNRLKSNKGKGGGTKVLKQLLEYIDSVGVPLLNTVSAYGNLDQDQLIQYYKMFGFVEVDKSNPDYGSDLLVYYPGGRKQSSLLRFGELEGKTIAVDFDATLHEYDGWDGPIPKGEPIEGALEFITGLLSDGAKVVIFSARAVTTEGLNGILDWLRENHFPEVPVTAVKPPADAYVDDRAVLFDGDWKKTMKGIEKVVESSLVFGEQSDAFQSRKVWEFVESKPFYNPDYYPKFHSAEDIYNSFKDDPEMMEKYKNFPWSGSGEEHPKEIENRRRRQNYDNLKGTGFLKKASTTLMQHLVRAIGGDANIPVFIEAAHDWYETNVLPHLGEQNFDLPGGQEYFTKEQYEQQPELIEGLSVEIFAAGIIDGNQDMWQYMEKHKSEAEQISSGESFNTGERVVDDRGVRGTVVGFNGDLVSVKYDGVQYSVPGVGTQVHYTKLRRVPPVTKAASMQKKVAELGPTPQEDKVTVYIVPVSGNEQFPGGGDLYYGTLLSIAKKHLGRYDIGQNPPEPDDEDDVQYFIQKLTGPETETVRDITVWAKDDVENYAMAPGKRKRSEMIAAVNQAYGGAEDEEPTEASMKTATYTEPAEFSECPYCHYALDPDSPYYEQDRKSFGSGWCPNCDKPLELGMPEITEVVNGPDRRIAMKRTGVDRTFQPGDKVIHIGSDMKGTVVHEVEAYSPEYVKLSRKYRKMYGVDFFDQYPEKPHAPFYVVNIEGTEEIAGCNELYPESGDTVKASKLVIGDVNFKQKPDGGVEINVVTPEGQPQPEINVSQPGAEQPMDGQAQPQQEPVPVEKPQQNPQPQPRSSLLVIGGEVIAFQQGEQVTHIRSGQTGTVSREEGGMVVVTLRGGNEGWWPKDQVNLATQQVPVERAASLPTQEGGEEEWNRANNFEKYKFAITEGYSREEADAFVRTPFKDLPDKLRQAFIVAMDEPWVDPAGGEHSHDPHHDPLKQYESLLTISKSPPGRKHEVEELKESGVPAEESFGIAWQHYNKEHGKPPKKETSSLVIGGNS